MSEPSPAMRASDAEREEEAAAALADAVATGRLSLADHDARLDALFAAATTDEVAAVVADLPARPERRSGLYRSAGPYRCVVIGGRLRRVGRFRIGRFCSLIVVFGTLELDLRAAQHSQDEVAITVWSFASRVAVTAPYGWRLTNQVFSLGAARAVPGNDRDPKAPLVSLRGASIGGSYTLAQG